MSPVYRENISVYLMQGALIDFYLNYSYTSSLLSLFSKFWRYGVRFHLFCPYQIFNNYEIVVNFSIMANKCGKENLLHAGWSHLFTFNVKGFEACQWSVSSNKQ